MHSVVVAKSGAALLQVLNPIETRILNFRRKILLHLTTIEVSDKPP
jgi:hypothetical protein